MQLPDAQARIVEEVADVVAGHREQEAAIRRIIDEAPDRVVLDLGRVEFIDSSGLGAVVAAMKQAGRNRRLELAALTSNVRKVFRLTRMDTVFTIHDDVAAAFAGLEHAS